MVTPPLLDGALGFNINRLAVLFRRHFISSLRAYRLTPEQWQVLVAIIEAEETQRAITLEQLVQLTLRDRQAVSRIIARMIRAGWLYEPIESKPKPGLRIRPTVQAEREFVQVRRELANAFAPILEKMSEQDRKRLLELTKQAIACFQESNI